jgi:hypothetical protein
MKPIVLASALLAASGLASAVHAEQRVYGLTRPQVVASLTCGSWTALDMVMHANAKGDEPFEAVLANVLKVGDADGDGVPWPRADIERHLRAAFAAKAAPSTQFARDQFVACLVAQQVPLDPALAGRCYMASFLPAALVPMAKDRGLDRAVYIAGVTPQDAPPDVQDAFRRIAGALWDRDPANAQKNAMEDVASFLACAAPGKPAFVDDAAPPPASN